MVYILNENFDPSVSGDVTFFLDRAALLYKIEPWLSTIPHLILDTKGNTFKLTLKHQKLKLESKGNICLNSVKSIIQEKMITLGLTQDINECQTFERLAEILEYTMMNKNRKIL
jgi:hypothetical protein